MKSRHTRSVQSFMVRYIRIMLLLFLGYITIYFTFFTFGEYHSLKRKQEEAAASARMYLQTSLNNISQVGYALRANKALYNLMYAPFTSDPYFYVEAYDEMSQRVSRSELLDSCYIYIIPSETVLASGLGKYHLDGFYDAPFLKEIDPALSVAYYLHTPESGYNTSSVSYLTQVSRFSTSLRSNAGFICMNISGEKLLEDIGAFTGYAWDIRIEDGNGLIFGTTDDGAGFDPGFYSVEEIGLQNLRITLATSRSAFLRTLFLTFFRDAALFLLFAVFLGTVLAILISTLNKTFQAMVLELADMYVESSVDFGIKELNYYFKKLVSDSKEYSARLRETSHIAKDKLLMDLLLGNAQDTPENERMSGYLGIRFPYPSYIAACITLEARDTPPPPEVILGAQAIIMQIAKREGEPLIYATVMGGMEIGMIVNFSNYDAAKAVLIDFAERIREETERNNVMSVFASYSKAVSRAELSAAYGAAKYNDSLKYFDGGQCYLFDPNPEANPAPLVTERLRRQIMLETQAQNFQAVYQLIKEMAAPYQSTADIGQTTRLQAALLILAGDIFSVTANDADEHVLKLYLQDISRIHLAEGSDSIYAAFVAFVNRVSKEYLLRYQPYNMNQYIAIAVDFIEKNYEGNVGVNDIAAHLNLNPKYFSRLFKNQTGFTVMQYLSDLRMKRAVELLDSTSLPVKEVGEMVGFPDSRSFIRHFKRCYGKTPGQFRVSATAGAK